MTYYRRRTMVLRTLIAVAAGFFAVWLGLIEGGADPAQEDPAATDRLVGDPAPVEPALAVELVEAGREPRQLLRYGAAAGVRQRVEVRVAADVNLELGGRPYYAERGPKIAGSASIEVASAAAERLELDIRFERVEAVWWEGFEMGRAEERRRSIESMRGRTYRFAMDRRGFADAPALEPPPDIDRESRRDPELAWSVLRAARHVIALPHEPVGVGARWRMIQKDRGGAMEAGPGITELELRSVRGRKLEIAVSAQFIVPPQVLYLRPELFAGISQDHSTGTGKVLLDLDAPLPTERESQSSFDVDGVWFYHSERLPFRYRVSSTETVTAAPERAR